MPRARRIQRLRNILFISRERIKHSSVEGSSGNHNNNNNSGNNNNTNNNNSNNSNNNNSVVHDEYQYFAPSDPNNPNNQANKATSIVANIQAAPILPSISQLPVALQQQAQHLQALQLQPDVTLTSLSVLQKATPPTTAGAAAVVATTVAPPTTATPITTAAATTSPGHVQLCSSSRSCSSSPSIYIKDEPDSQDETGRKSQQKLATIRPQTKQQLKARLRVARVGGTTPLYATPPPHLIINTNNELIDVDAGDCIDDEDDDLEYEDDDDLDDDDRAAPCPPIGDVDMMGAGGRLSPGSSSFTAAGVIGTPRHQPSPREMLYIKFGDFLAARLNTLHETAANELMNKILLLVAEK